MAVYCDWGYLYLGSLMKIKGIGELLNPSPMLLLNIIQAIYNIPITFSLNKVENCWFTSPCILLAIKHRDIPKAYGQCPKLRAIR